VDDSGTIDEDTAVDINVLDNDTDADGDNLMVSDLTQPAHGSTSIKPDGTIRYTPDADFNGSDSFTYTVTDHNGGTATANVTVNITPVNDALVLKTNPDNQAGLVGDRVSLAIEATDPNGDRLEYAADGLPAGLTINSDTGTITGKLTTAGTYAVTVNVSDGALSDTANFTWTVALIALENPGDQRNYERDRVWLRLKTTLPDIGRRGRRPRFSATGLPPGLTINPHSGVIDDSGVIHGRLRRHSKGTHAVTVMVTAGETSASASFTWTVERRKDRARDPEAEEPDESDGEAETSESFTWTVTR
jgi:VCBS repeat-containing protein